MINHLYGTIFRHVVNCSLPLRLKDKDEFLWTIAHRLRVILCDSNPGSIGICEIWVYREQTGA